LCDDGHQTQVITSRWDLRDIEVAYRMFERWRQENFFKGLLQIEWVIFVILRAIPVFDGDAIAWDW
jgi:hypothetical protein